MCLDTGIQTKDFTIPVQDQFCQTDRLQKDFQAQANLQLENRSIAVQAVFPVQDQAAQTIKQEIDRPNIPMPNIPNSVGQTHSKKRKLSSTSRTANTATQNETTQTATLESDIDPAILNSEVYQIYCQSENPEEAMNKIEKMKTCIYFSGWNPSQLMPTEENLKRAFDKALEKIWSYGPTKWESIQKFMEMETDYNFHDIKVPIGDNSLEDSIPNILELCFAHIEMIHQNGIEFFFVKNFHRGVALSHWYRGFSDDSSVTIVGDSWTNYSRRMAMLNAMGITNSMIREYHYDFLRKKPVKSSWLNFAVKLVEEESDCFFPDRSQWEELVPIDGEGNSMSGPYSSIQESKTEDTITITATLQFRWRVPWWVDKNEPTHFAKTYHGKSTRPKKTRRPKNEKKEMTKEAKASFQIDYSSAVSLWLRPSQAGSPSLYLISRKRSLVSINLKTPLRKRHILNVLKIVLDLLNSMIFSSMSFVDLLLLN